MVHATDAIFTPVVGLISGLPTAFHAPTGLIIYIDKDSLVRHALKGIIYLIGKRRKLNRLPYPDTLLQQLLVTHLRTTHHSHFLPKQAVSRFYAPLVVLISKREGGVALPHTCVVEQISRRTSVARVFKSALQAPRYLAIKRQRSLYLSYRSHLPSVASIIAHHVSLHLRSAIRQGFGVHQNDATQCFRTVSYRLRTFHYHHIVVGILVNFWCMVYPPLLTSKLCSPTHYQYSVAIHAMYHRFCHTRTGLEHAYPTDVL